MSMLLVLELHEARDRVLLLRQRLENARQRELPAYRTFLDEQVGSLTEALEQAHIPEYYRVAVVGRFKVGKSAFVNKLLDQRLAGVDTNPETAAISVFRYGKETRAQVELICAAEWNQLKADHADDPKNPEVKRYASFVSFNERAVRKEKSGKDARRAPINFEELVRQWVVPGGNPMRQGRGNRSHHGSPIRGRHG